MKSSGSVQAYAAQVEAGVVLSVNLRGTQVRCGRDAQVAAGLDADQLAALGCGGGGGGTSAAKVVLVLFLIAVAAGAAVAGFLFWRRRRAGGSGAFSHRNVPGAASQYVSEAELNGSDAGQQSARTYTSSLGEKPTSGAFAFMPQFLKDGTGPMAGLLGKQYSDATEQQSSAAAYVGSSGGGAGGLGAYNGKGARGGEAQPQLPVSASRHDSAERERRHARRSKSGRSAAGGGLVAERIMEMSPPLSSVEASDSPPPSRRVKGGKRPGGRTVGLTPAAPTDEDDPERGMNITFNAAYDGGQN